MMVVDFAKESESVDTAFAIYLAECHGKGSADSAAGGSKTMADKASICITVIETAYELYIFLGTHYKQVCTRNLSEIHVQEKINTAIKIKLIYKLPQLCMLPWFTTKLYIKLIGGNSIISKRDFSYVSMKRACPLSSVKQHYSFAA